MAIVVLINYGLCSTNFTVGVDGTSEHLAALSGCCRAPLYGGENLRYMQCASCGKELCKPKETGKLLTRFGWWIPLNAVTHHELSEWISDWTGIGNLEVNIEW